MKCIRSMPQKQVNKGPCELLECGSVASWQCQRCGKGLCEECSANWEGPCPFCRMVRKISKKSKTKVYPSLTVRNFTQFEEEEPYMTGEEREMRRDSCRKCTDTVCFDPKSRKCKVATIIWLVAMITYGFFLKAIFGFLTLFESMLISALVFTLMIHCCFYSDCYLKFL